MQGITEYGSKHKSPSSKEGGGKAETKTSQEGDLKSKALINSECFLRLEDVKNINRGKILVRIQIQTGQVISSLLNQRRKNVSMISRKNVNKLDGKISLRTKEASEGVFQLPWRPVGGNWEDRREKSCRPRRCLGRAPLSPPGSSRS